MPRIYIRYDAAMVRGSDLAVLMPELAQIGADQYFTTPEKVIVELFELNPHSLNHRTLDLEVNALPDPERRRETRIEDLALTLSEFLLEWLRQRGIQGTVGVETRIFASGAYAWATVGEPARVTHSSARQV